MERLNAAAICLVFVRLNAVLKCHEYSHLSQTLNSTVKKRRSPFKTLLLVWTARFKIYEAEGRDGNGNMTSVLSAL